MRRSLGDHIHIDILGDRCVFLEQRVDGGVILFNLEKREIQDIDGSFIADGWIAR